jgi:uncharacterized protein YdhG (YjbR/CyaY superfamily)
MRMDAKTMDEYIAAYPLAIRKLLNSMRKTIKKAAPMAEEAVRYGIPTFRLNGNLVHFGAFKHHIGFYPTASGIAAFRADLARFKNSKGAVQFPFGEPLPLALVSKITKHRVKENLLKYL